MRGSIRSKTYIVSEGNSIETLLTNGKYHINKFDFYLQLIPVGGRRHQFFERYISVSTQSFLSDSLSTSSTNAKTSRWPFPDSKSLMVSRPAGAENSQWFRGFSAFSGRLVITDSHTASSTELCRGSFKLKETFLFPVIRSVIELSKIATNMAAYADDLVVYAP